MITDNQMTELLEQIEQQSQRELKKQLEKWGSNKLVQICFILQTPSYDDGEEFLPSSDLQELRRLCLELRDEILKPEVR
jgi:hypothetical protein